MDDNPFGGIFVGKKISAANAMVISIVILIVSVVVSAVVLYIRFVCNFYRDGFVLAY